MAIRPIRRLGDPVLRTVADPVTSFDAGRPAPAAASPLNAGPLNASPPR